MALLVDIQRVLRRPEDVQALASAVWSADENDELDWIEWKGSLDLSAKAGAAAVARAVLGLANREPARAARHCGGCGYVVVGVEPGNALGVAKLDPAVLSQALNPYLGGHDGPVWSPQYARVEGVDVLVVIVEPPVAGDRVFPLRRTYQTLSTSNEKATTVLEGTVFVRHVGKTERATASDIDMLSARAAAKPTTDLPDEVTVAVRPAMLPLSVFAPRSDLDGVLAQVRTARLAEARRLDAQRPDPLEITSKFIRFGDTRTIADYERQLDDYLGQWREVFPAFATVAFVDDPSSRLTLSITNLGMRNLRGTELVLQLPDGVTVLDEWPEEPDRPRAPKALGEQRPDSTSLLIPPYIGPLSAPTFGNWTYACDGKTVTFDSIDLRPQKTEHLEEMIVLVDESHADNSAITIEWRVTSTAFDGVRRGSFSVPISGCIGTDRFLPDELL